MGERILIADRKPEVGQIVLATVKRCTVPFSYTWRDDENDNEKVIAWMPLPEIYKEGSHGRMDSVL